MDFVRMIINSFCKQVIYDQSISKLVRLPELDISDKDKINDTTISKLTNLPKIN